VTTRQNFAACQAENRCPALLVLGVFVTLCSDCRTLERPFGFSMSVEERPARAFFLVSAAVLAVAAAGVVLGRLVVGPLASWLDHTVDAPARSFSLDHSSAGLTRVAKDVSVFGRAAVTGSVAAVVGFVWWHRTRNARPALVLATAFAGALSVALMVKYGVHRSPAAGPTPRFSPGTFPSGHALFATAVYGAIAVLLLRAKGLAPIRTLLAVMLVALSFAVDGSRIYLLDHYASDVLGGGLLGIALIAGALTIFGCQLRPGPRD
jgi:undecaprenyl-diphosphatase